jgi:methylated-DNA-[protein]-cysteine S-methyltransferase
MQTDTVFPVPPVTSGPRHRTVPTVLGDLLLVAHDEALAGVYFPGHWYPPTDEFCGRPVPAERPDPVLDAAATQLGEYLAGTRQTFDVPTVTASDAFSERVWALLRKIPYGRTTTYGRLAIELGNRALAQRVGQAVGHNPLSIVIPCHRVVGADGSLTGYAGGIERKQFLLDLEQPGTYLFRTPFADRG